MDEAGRNPTSTWPHPKKDTRSRKRTGCSGCQWTTADPTLLHTADFLQDLAVVRITAGLFTVLSQQLRQPIVLGYIIAGVINRAHTTLLPRVQDEETISTLAELVGILLLFFLGLEFSVQKLKKAGGSVTITVGET